jgi:mannitol-specific phosphotransferase system IIBC component
MNFKADKNVLTISGIVLLFIICVVVFEVSLSLKRERDALRSQQKEMLVLANEYAGLKNTVASVEAKKSLTNVEGIVQAVDEVFKSMGLGQKVKSVKSTGTREKKYASEEEAEVSVERVTMNEMVNILYRIENAPMILSVRRTSIKTSFDNPSLLNITMTVGLIKPK